MDNSNHTPASINFAIYHHPLLHRFHLIHFPNLLMRYHFFIDSVNFLTYLNVLLVAAVLRRCAKQLPECMFICHTEKLYIDTLVTNVISIKSDTAESFSAYLGRCLAGKFRRYLLPFI